MFDCVSLVVLCCVVGFAGWKGGVPERGMAVTIFVSWCTYVGLTLHAARPSGIGLAASDVALTVGMAICGHTEADQGTRRYVGLVQLLAAVSMVFGGAGRLLEAAGVVPVVSNLLVVSHLASCGALAFLVLATVRRMKLNGERRTTSNVDLEQLPPGPFAIN